MYQWHIGYNYYELEGQGFEGVVRSRLGGGGASEAGLEELLLLCAFSKMAFVKLSPYFRCLFGLVLLGA